MLKRLFLEYTNPDGGDVKEINNSILFGNSCNHRNCQYYTINIDPGTYIFEAWGSCGSTNVGGKGGFVSGNITFNNRTTLYLYVGNFYGYNGGGEGGKGYKEEGKMYPSGNGGGASDVRTSPDLRNRIMVAGAGGGAAHGYLYYEATIGYNFYVKEKNNGCDANAYCANILGTATRFGKPGIVGTTTSGGKGGSGGTVKDSSEPKQLKRFYLFGAGGGGGGYYGGGGGGSGAIVNGSKSKNGLDGETGMFGIGGKGADAPSDKPISVKDVSHSGAGAGGSNYIDQRYFSNTISKSGKDTFLNPNGYTETGHGTHGAIKITSLKKSNLASNFNIDYNSMKKVKIRRRK